MRALSRVSVYALINVAIVAALVVMLYPLIWMLSASFKTGYEIFHSLSLLPQAPSLDNYISGWTALRLPFSVFFMNSVVLCAAAVLGNTISCTLAAFAFARLRFPLKRVLFAVMLMTIMLPFHATIVPQFVLYEHLGWVGTILPIVVPKFLAVDAFFVFLLVQFIRNIPTSLDDAAKIDGCGPFRLFYWVILPLLTPALATTAIFTFIFTWNDFFSQLLYLGNSVSSYTVPVALRAFIDATSLSSWPQTLAMSLLSLLPIIGFFMAFQRLLVEGISTTGLKG
ncbi:MAG TPA: carbohydrate ABC transporter permease [Candidatus Dormibacteraeota bacterium]|nr:carbohydrate ABC transporter permease [Candidatus Dormibacteraeota bacterium]